MRCGIEAISLWHCLGVMEAQISLMLAVSSSLFLGLVSLIFLLIIPHTFSMGFRSGELAGQSSTVMAWASNQGLVLLAVWAGARSCWKMKSAPPYSSSAEGIMKCSKTFEQTVALTLDLRKQSLPKPALDIAPQIMTDCGYFTLDLKQLGLLRNCTGMEMQISSSNKTWPLLIPPEAPKHGLMPMPSRCLTGQPTRQT